jgi:diguanylate cyclase
LTEADLEQIYETYLSHIKTTDRIDKVGARVISEIDEVMTPLTDALGMSASYDASLDDASQKLGAAKSREQVKAILEVLVKSTHEMRETNKALEDRLTLYKNEISNLQQNLEAIRAGAAAGRHVVEADYQGPGHHRTLWRRGPTPRCARRLPSPITSAAP